jgi:F420-dependent oxidoreductase-like protein
MGYQIPNFTYPGGPAEIFPRVVAQAREAEAAGFDTVLLMDHFYQLLGIGKPNEPMLECYTTLGALARATKTVQLSSLVTGNTYRNPAILAKTVSTLDVVSGGRAVLGVGAGWYELEHDAFGLEFGTFTDRFERLNEALNIIAALLHGEHSTHQGRWYQTRDAFNEPRIRDNLPIMLGGGGEKKTFALAARYADHLNIICNASELSRKLDALAERCGEAGRDRATIETSYLAFVIVDEDGDAARRMQREVVLRTGTDLDALSPQDRAAATDRHFVGTPEQVAEQLRTRVLDAGVDGVLLNLVANGHRPGAVHLAARAASAALAG